MASEACYYLNPFFMTSLAIFFACAIGGHFLNAFARPLLLLQRRKNRLAFAV